MLKNRLKEKLLSGQPAFGVSVMFPSPQVVEMVGRLGFDWVLIDCEHGSISPESVELMAMAAELAGVTAIARPWSNSPEAILRLMDRGVMGVQVPHVNTAADARQAVESVKFHPLGTRGLAAGTRPAHYGFNVSAADYVEEANRETLVCIQLEEAEALGNLGEILQVEGVDVFFIGPSDLSQSLGYPGRSDAPEVREAMDRAFADHRGGGQGARIGRQSPGDPRVPAPWGPLPVHAPSDAPGQRQQGIPRRRQKRHLILGYDNPEGRRQPHPEAGGINGPAPPGSPARAGGRTARRRVRPQTREEVFLNNAREAKHFSGRGALVGRFG